MLAALVSAFVLMAGRYIVKYMNERPRNGGRPSPARPADPASAGATLLVLTALAREGQVTEPERAEIERSMQVEFGIDPGAATALFSYGRMAAGQIDEPFHALGGLLRPIRATCTKQECANFITMMEAVARVGGEPTREASMLIEESRDALTLDPQADL